MNAHTKIGGANRAGLLRVWFLFFLWGFVTSVTTPQPDWRGFLCLLGSAFTLLLLYRRNRLAGIVGFLVSASVVLLALPEAAVGWRHFASGRFFGGPFAWFSPSALYALAVPLVPAVVLALHIASRHRILRAFEGREQHRGRAVTTSSYYLITNR